MFERVKYNRLDLIKVDGIQKTVIDINVCGAVWMDTSYQKTISKYGYEGLNSSSDNNNSSQTNLNAAIFPMIIDECGTFSSKTYEWKIYSK